MKRSSFYLAIAYFILSFVLLTLPGSTLPQGPLFDIPNFDKLVHTGIFALLVFLFCRPFRKAVHTVDEKKQWFSRIAILCLAYGIIMEIVQKYFIPNRSFDWVDIVVDALGCMIGVMLSRRLFVSSLKKQTAGN